MPIYCNYVKLKPISLDSDYLSQFLFNVETQAPTFGAIIALAIGVSLLFASGFISASEIAFFSLSPADKSKIVEKKDNQTDLIIESLLNNSEKLLATILIANNLVNVSVVMLFTYFMNAVIVDPTPVFRFVSQTLILTFLLLLFGEIMPKIYASYNTLFFARRSAPVLNVLFSIFSPLSSLLVKGTKVINKQFTPRSKKLSIGDLSHALELTSDGITDEKSMLQEIIKFGDKRALEVMTSRVNMTAVDITTGYEQVLQIILDTNYSRIPVYENSEDQIKGILYIKDLLPHLSEKDDFQWISLIRPAYHVPETKKIDNLLEEFRSKKIHMAIVVDEFGGTSGLITLEDVLEEIVGEISDEYDEDEALYKKINNDNWVFEAQIQLGDFYRAIDMEDGAFGKEAEECETLAGLLLEIKGDFPDQDETIVYNEYQFKVLDIDDRRILKILYTNPGAEVVAE